MNGALNIGPVASADNGDGTFSFKMPNGQTITATGAAAEQKHAYLQSTNAYDPSGGMGIPDAGPQVAGPGGGFDLGASVAGAAGVPMRNPEAAVPAAMPKGTLDVPGLSAPGGVPAYLTRPEEAPLVAPKKPGEASAAKAGAVNHKTLVGAQGGGGTDIPTVVTGQPTGGGRVIPGKMVQTGEQTSQTVIPEADKADIKAGSGEKLAANEKLSKAEQAQADAMYQQKLDTNAELERRDAMDQAKENERQSYLEDQRSKLQHFTSQAQAMKDVDPDAYWGKHGGLAGKLAGGIAEGMMQAGMALAGNSGPNIVTQGIQNSIDRDIAAQKDNYDKARGNVDAQRSLYSDAMKHFGDERQAASAVRATYIDQAIRQLDSTTEGSKSAIIRARAQAMKGQLLEERGRAMGDVEKISDAKSYAMTRPQVVGGGAQVNLRDNVAPETTFKALDGTVHEAPSADAAKAAETQVGAVRTQLSDVQEAKALAAQASANPALKLDPEFKRRVEGVTSRMLLRTSKAEGGTGARLSDKSVEIGQKIMGGDIGSITTFGQSAGVKEYEAGLHSEAGNVVKQTSRHQLKEQLYLDPKTGKRESGFVRGQRPSVGTDLGSAVDE